MCIVIYSEIFRYYLLSFNFIRIKWIKSNKMDFLFISIKQIFLRFLFFVCLFYYIFLLAVHLVLSRSLLIFVRTKTFQIPCRYFQAFSADYFTDFFSPDFLIF